MAGVPVSYHLELKCDYWYVIAIDANGGRRHLGSGLTVEEALDNSKFGLPPGATLVIPLTLKA